jgi:hypothetical protein
MSPAVAQRVSRERSHRAILQAPGRRGRGGASTPFSAPSTTVLLAGVDPDRRALLREEIAATLPHRARFIEAEEVCEVLERAPLSRLVILAGDLADTDAESLMRMLGHRHPQLPVVCVEDEAVGVGVVAEAQG